MAHASRFIQRGDRLGARRLAAAGVDQLDRQCDIGRAQHAGDHLPALVGFGHHAVGLPGMGRIGHGAGPAFGRRIRHGTVGPDIGGAVHAQHGHHDPAGIAGRTGRRVDRHDDAPCLRYRAHVPVSFDQRAAPQRAFDRGDHFALQFLPPEIALFELFDHRGEVIGGQHFPIVQRAAARHGDLASLRIRHDPAHQRGLARGGGGDHARAVPQPHRQLQIVPGRHGPLA